MSLFENDEFRWRDTYFVLFHEKDRPSADATLQSLQTLGPRYQVQDVRYDEEGRLESLTLLSPDDFAAMDISYISGEEVEEQVQSLSSEMGVAIDQGGNQETEVAAGMQCPLRYLPF